MFREAIQQAADVLGKRDIFLAALEKQEGQERDSYLESACGSDQDLRARVEQLLRAHEKAGSFLEQPAAQEVAGRLRSEATEMMVAAVDKTDARRPTADPMAGSSIGRYRLLERLGEGGMGVVYIAEQREPVRRRVALKIIKPGMDSDQVVARFEAERQALAMLDHTSIAKVFDAGTTELGRPYFVMELVHGAPITEYCDENRLTPRERVELFMAVCHAVQHAHQKGIIHRDLKPSNILIASYDGRPVPKIIDFGVAKATNQPLTERTIYTNFGAMVGTLEYMAPEQAQMNALGVDTRSDIYSLGVLLYELLTGTTPLERGRLRNAAFKELLRLLEHEEPPAPSTRLSAAGEQLQSISEQRKTEPARLVKVVSGELDWIAMKCLEKDRSRRYETAHGLALDIQRYLNDEAVLAGPPSARYKTLKFVRRNRSWLSAAAAVLLALVAGLGAATYGLVRAREERNHALAATIEAKEAQEIAQVQTALAQSNEKVARKEAAKAQAVSHFLQRMFSRARLRATSADTSVRHFLLEGAETLSEEQISKDPEVESAIRDALGAGFSALGMYQEAEPQLRLTLELRKRIYPADHPEIAESLSSLSELYTDKHLNKQSLHSYEYRQDLETAYKLESEALAILEKALGPSHPKVAASLANLSYVSVRLDRLEEAAAHSERSAEIARKLHSGRRPQIVAALYTQAISLRAKGELDEAERLAKEAIAICIEVREKKASLANSYNLLGLILKEKGRVADAANAYRESIKHYREISGDDHLALVMPLRNLVQLHRAHGDLREADVAALELVRVELHQFSQSGAGRAYDASFLATKGFYNMRLGKFDEAAAEFENSLELDPLNHDLWFFSGCAHLYVGDRQKYERCARELYERGSEIEEVSRAQRTVMLCALTPKVIGDPAIVRELAEFPNASKQWFVWPWFSLTRALVEYRYGRYEVALEWISRAYSVDKNGLQLKPRSFALVLSAMALHQLGQHERALADLDSAEQLIAHEFPKPGAALIELAEETFPTWILVREARQLISPTVEPRREFQSDSPNRALARWVFWLGGRIGVAQGAPAISDLASLPREHFEISMIGLEKSSLSDTGLLRFAKLDRLQTLWIGGAPITDRGLVHIGEIKTLDWLGLDDCQITDAGLAHLKGLENLGQLQLAKTLISDHGLAHLSGLKKLRAISLNENSITDAGLTHLYPLEALTFLDLSHTEVTPAAVEELKRRLPKVTVRVDSPSGARGQLFEAP